MIKLKATSRLGKRHVERTGTTLVGDPMETPRPKERAAEVGLPYPE